MKRAKYVLRKYQSLGTVYGSELLLDHQQALGFIDDCAQASLVILGMDFYRETDGIILPVEASADYSSLSEAPEAVAQSGHAAKNLINDGLPDGASYVSFVVEVRKGGGNRGMTTPRMGPDREEIEGWIEFDLEDIEKQRKKIAAGQGVQGTYESLSSNYMDLGRARYLKGIWFQSLSTRAIVKEARAAFQQAAECIEMNFRMAYDPALPEYLGDKANWTWVMETHGISGFTAALMASDFALARRFAPWPRRSPDNAPMDDEVCNYVDALQACLLNDPGTAAQLCRLNIDKFSKKKSTKRDFRMNYHTLSMALLGIVEKNEVRFNGGLAAQLEFYEPEATHGEEQDTSEEFICDHAVALANLGLWSGMKLHTKHRLMPADLLISTHPALAK